MNESEIAQNLAENLSLGEKPSSQEACHDETEKNNSDSQKENTTPPSTANKETIAPPTKIQTRIPRPSGIKAPTGVSRIPSASAQRPISSIQLPSQLASPKTLPGANSQEVASPLPPSAGNTSGLMANRSISYPTNNDDQSVGSGNRSRNNNHSTSRTDCYSSNNSHCADTESQGSSGSRISSSNYSYISLGEPRMINAKINSLANIDHVPGGGNVRIFNQKIDTSNVSAKCGSTANIKYKPGGGDVKILNQKLDIKAQAKTQSLKNVKHVPGGGDKKIHNETLPWLKYNAPKLSAEEKKRITQHKLKL